MRTLKYAVYTVPLENRMPRLSSLIAKLNRPVEIVVDHDFIGPAHNFVNTLERLTSMGSEHMCVMQDDIVIAEHFSDAVEAFTPVFFQDHPMSVISFYSKNLSKYRRAYAKGERIYQQPVTISDECSTWLLSSLIPVEIAKQFCAFYHELNATDSFPDTVRRHHKERRFISDDSLFSRFLAMFGYSAFCSTHSLVQHAGGMNSSLGHNHRPESGHYVAPNFIGEDADARKFLVAK